MLNAETRPGRVNPAGVVFFLNLYRSGKYVIC